ncbi:ciliary microtubule inner protein 2C [Lepisosteus oculatus]|uniref:ciliary microtubule inner protein 2C n=1 Tax=Lepisosteus oculatus TaxID=7918 RepID=UPI0035F50A3D
MAYRSVGTLVTHNNATYIPPAVMPGYRGHVPTTRYLYGDTFGNATVKYFQNFRCAVMESSKSPYSSGGQFPTIYSHNPCLVTACRSRSRDRALHTPYWARNNVDFSRQEELKLFDKLAQKHRESYKDKIGTLQPVKYFILPVQESEKCNQKNM